MQALERAHVFTGPSVQRKQRQRRAEMGQNHKKLTENSVKSDQKPARPGISRLATGPGYVSA